MCLPLPRGVPKLYVPSSTCRSWSVSALPLARCDEQRISQIPRIPGVNRLLPSCCKHATSRIYFYYFKISLVSRRFRFAGGQCSTFDWGPVVLMPRIEHFLGGFHFSSTHTQHCGYCRLNCSIRKFGLTLENSVCLYTGASQQWAIVPNPDLTYGKCEDAGAQYTTIPKSNWSDECHSAITSLTSMTAPRVNQGPGAWRHVPLGCTWVGSETRSWTQTYSTDTYTNTSVYNSWAPYTLVCRLSAGEPTFSLSLRCIMMRPTK